MAATMMDFAADIMTMKDFIVGFGLVAALVVVEYISDKNEK